MGKRYFTPKQNRKYPPPPLSLKNGIQISPKTDILRNFVFVSCWLFPAANSPSLDPCHYLCISACQLVGRAEPGYSTLSTPTCTYCSVFLFCFFFCSPKSKVLSKNHLDSLNLLGIYEFTVM